jgi:hypothetical protein
MLLSPPESHIENVLDGGRRRQIWKALDDKGNRWGRLLDHGRSIKPRLP